MSVRTRIIDAIVFAVQSLDGVGMGGVIRPGLDERTVAEAITARITSGKYAVELVVGHDDPEGDPRDTINVQRWAMPVGLYIHLPSPLPAIEGTDGFYTADQIASAIHKACYLMYQGETTTPGRWSDAGGVTARSTSCLGGGGVYIDERYGTNVTEHAMLVSYAHSAIDPDVVA